MFIFDCECHMMPLADDINYFPFYKMNQWALRNMRNLFPLVLHGLRENVTAADLKEFANDQKRRVGYAPGESGDALIEKMDTAGVQMACVLPESFLPMSMGVRMMSTNGWLAAEIKKYPERLIGVCNVGPIAGRGIKNALWELEYLVKEMNFKAVKLYPVDDLPINDERLWPYYEKVRELGIPLFVHTGFSYCVPGRSSNCFPWLLEDVCENFPEIPILAYHMGYPFTDALNMCAMKYRNLFIGTSLLPLFGHGISRRAQILLGEAIACAGIDKIIWGTDSGATNTATEWLEKFQINESVQKEYGYKPLSNEDRAKWAGLNLAKMMKITPPEAAK